MSRLGTFLGCVVIAASMSCTFSANKPISGGTGGETGSGTGGTHGPTTDAFTFLSDAAIEFIGSSDGAVCTNLCKNQMQCSGGGTTSVSGTVLAPTPPAYGLPDPIYNAVVYVPNAAVQAFATGVSCDRCGTPLSGSPLVKALTGPDGKFTLTNVPVGTNIPLVIQIGRWRRQVVIPQVTACTETALPADLTRLPRNKQEGDIPLMAMVTGNVDTLECVLLKIGIDAAEFTEPSGNGRVQLHVANGANVSATTPAAATLTGSPTALANYDIVLFACEGSPITKPNANRQNVINYSNLGGRVFATHFEYTYLFNTAPFSMTANWNADQAHPPDPLTGLIDTSFPKGQAFAQWLQIVGASTTSGQIPINVSRHDLDGVVAPSQRWIYSTTPSTIQHYTFNTPVGTAADQQCGKVLFSDFHVNNAMAAMGMAFPRECTAGPLTPQEKVLEFMMFDLASCIQPDNQIPIIP